MGEMNLTITHWFQEQEELLRIVEMEGVNYCLVTKSCLNLL